jgi:hypothetical protein
MRPRPPGVFAARRLAADIRPPLLFFMVITPFSRKSHTDSLKLDSQITDLSVRQRTKAHQAAKRVY